MCGTIEVNVCINGFHCGHTFIVVKDLRQQGLIGIDFLQSYRGDISIAQKTLFLMDGLVAINVTLQLTFNCCEEVRFKATNIRLSNLSRPANSQQVDSP